MANVQHNALTDPNLHEPKGVAAATAGKCYVSNGAGSGTWKYIPTGWGYYKDNSSAQTIGSTAVKLSIDGAGSTTSTVYLPYEIRGTGNLWNTTTDKITPINIGDAYDVRLDLPVTGKSGTPAIVTLELDIGGGGTPTIVVVELDTPTSKTPPYNISIAFPIFCLTTFNTNGGQIFMHTDTGSIDVTAPGIFIGLNTSGTF